jgi:Acyltransferase
MIKAQKNKKMATAIEAVQTNLMHRYFSTVRLRVDLDVYQPSDVGTIYFGNHSSRWDHHFGLYITERLWNQDSYLMVTEGMMAVYPFLRYSGCYTINNQDPLDVVQSLKYSKELLVEKPSRSVWLFPQGIVRHSDMRPLGFGAGLAQLIRSMERVRLVPVTFRYEFGLNTKAEAFMSFGKPFYLERNQKLNSRALTLELEKIVTTDLEKLKNDIITGNTADFITILQSKGLLLTRGYTKANQLFWKIFYDTNFPLVGTLLEDPEEEKEKAKEPQSTLV